MRTTKKGLQAQSPTAHINTHDVCIMQRNSIHNVLFLVIEFVKCKPILRQYDNIELVDYAVTVEVGSEYL